MPCPEPGGGHEAAGFHRSFRRCGVAGGVRLTTHFLPGDGVMEIFGAAIGMVVALATLAVALWEFPSIRQAFFRGRGFLFMATALLGGWVGYWIFATVFHG